MKIILFILLCTAVVFSASDTVTTASGLKYIVIQKGTGPRAELNKNAEVHYTGSLLDGKVFDSSVKRNQPIEFVLGTGQVIQGWDEGIALMNVGDKLRLIIPPALGYGEKGAGDVIPPNSTLIFDVELISVSEPKVSIADVMLDLVLKDSVDACADKYHQLKKESPEEYNFKEAQLNNLGYQLLQYGKIKEAVEILRLNAEAYPESANVYDSLGEAYFVLGNKDKAAENYQKSLELNPDNENAKEKLKQLAK